VSDDRLAQAHVELAALRRARVSGLHQVRFRDREMTYRSDKELLAAIRDLEAELGRSRPRRLLTTAHKGL
jgi:hypothetical protein